MSKIHLKVTLDVLVDTDLTNTSEMMDNIEFEVYSNDCGELDVQDFEVLDYEISDAR